MNLYFTESSFFYYIFKKKGVLDNFSGINFILIFEGGISY